MKNVVKPTALICSLMTLFASGIYGITPGLYDHVQVKERSNDQYVQVQERINDQHVQVQERVDDQHVQVQERIDDHVAVGSPEPICAHCHHPVILRNRPHFYGRVPVGCGYPRHPNGVVIFPYGRTPDTVIIHHYPQCRF